jgi:hypothetical protein
MAPVRQMETFRGISTSGQSQISGYFLAPIDVEHREGIWPTDKKKKIEHSFGPLSVRRP